MTNQGVSSLSDDVAYEVERQKHRERHAAPAFVQSHAETNLNALEVATVGLSEHERHLLESHLIGALSGMIDADQWTRLVLAGRRFVMRPSVASDEEYEQAAAPQ